MSSVITRYMTNATAKRLFDAADRARREREGFALPSGPGPDPERVTYWLEHRTGAGPARWSKIDGCPMFPRYPDHPEFRNSRR
ncbi:MAG: hypothetical protein WC977_01280 [Anaerovoracaceae bacterium]